MTTFSNIKYILIGNLANKQILTEFTITNNDQIKNESYQIFDKLCTNNKIHYNTRNKIQSYYGYMYFICSPPNRFYFAIAEPSFPERLIFEMIENIDNDNLFLLITEKGELNQIGRQSLKNIVDKFQDMRNLSKIQHLNEDVNFMKEDVSRNVKNVIDNIANVQELEVKSNRIKLNSDSFKREAIILQKKTFCSRFKWMIIFVFLILGIVLLFLLPLFYKN